MKHYLNFYLVSTAICLAMGLIKLVSRLAKDRRSKYDFDRVTWGEVTMCSAMLLVPAINIATAGWWVFSPIWDGVEWILSKMDKPVIPARKKATQEPTHD